MASVEQRTTCPACGRDITITDEDASTDSAVGIAVSIRHPQPVDAACRLVLETLTDEQKRLADLRVQSAVEHIERLSRTRLETPPT